MACYFNQDFDILYGTLDGAIAAAARDGSLDHRQAVLKEWRDWNVSEGAVDDIRPNLDDSLSIDVLFKRPIDARDLMNLLYDRLIEGVRAETRHDA